MLGYCGVYCDKCRAYRGTVSGDMALLEQAAGSFGNGQFAAADWVCLGCQPADQPFLARFCAQCKIRACAVEKQVPNCAACASYDGCQLLHDFIKNEGEEIVRTMALLRQSYLDRQK
jgi:hypothetical protein